MTTIRESLYIIYNDINFQDLGVISCNISSGSLLQEPVWGNRTIVETKVRGRPVNYFHSVEDEPLSFSLNLGVVDAWDSDSIRNIMRSLRTDFYAPLILSAKPDQKIYAIVEGQPILNHTASSTGYITVNFKCSSPYWYGNVVESDIDLTVNPSGTTITRYNLGDMNIPTLITVTKIGAGNVTILNTTNSDLVTLTSLENLQKIIVDSENEDIQSSPRGVFTFTGVSNDTETITVGNQIYEVDNNSTITSGHIAINTSGGNSSSQSATAFALAVTTNMASDCDAYASGSTVILIPKLANTFGADFLLSDTISNGSWNFSTMQDVYPYASWNSQGLTLENGINNILISGTCLVNFSWKPRMLAGE